MVGGECALRPQDLFPGELEQHETDGQDADGDIQFTSGEPANELHADQHPDDHARQQVLEIPGIPFSPVGIKREGVPGAQEGEQDPDGVARAEREDTEGGAEQSEGAAETGLRDADEQHGQDGDEKGRPIGIREEMHGDGLAWKGGGWKEIIEVGLRGRSKPIESATK